MKNIITSSLLLIISAITYCQQTPKYPEPSGARYLEKGLKQRHAANAMLWGGTSILFVGGLIYIKETGFIIDNGEPPSTVSKLLEWTGLTAIVGSLPLFIAYHKNKRKAASLSFKNNVYQQIQGNGFVNKTIPSLSLKINL